MTRGTATLGAFVVVIAACGRVDFDVVAELGASEDAGNVGDADRPCEPFWMCDFALTDPEHAAALNGPGNELEPYLSDDGLTMYFSSDRSGVTRDWVDCYRATRPAWDAPFGDVTPIEWVNTEEHQETRYAPSPDGLEVFVGTSRPTSTGAADLFHARRATPDEPFGELVELVRLNTEGSEYDPWPADAGRKLYFVTDGRSDGAGGQDIFMAERGSRDAPFENVEAVAGLNTEFQEDNPTFSPDELFVVFGSDRPGGAGAHDLWYARRPSKDVPFEEPAPLPVVNTPAIEGEPFVAVQSRELWFVSTRPGGQGGWDLYRSHFVPVP